VQEPLVKVIVGNRKDDEQILSVFNEGRWALPLRLYVLLSLQLAQHLPLTRVPVEWLIIQISQFYSEIHILNHF
jgi:hypothetical protein